MTHEKLVKLIRKATGLPFGEWVKTLETNTPAMFRYRYQHGVLRLSDYHKILQATGLTFEDLFPNPHGVPKQRVLQTVFVQPSGPAKLPEPGTRAPLVPQDPGPSEIPGEVVMRKVEPSMGKAIEPKEMTIEEVVSQSPVKEKTATALADIDIPDIYDDGDPDGVTVRNTEDPTLNWKPVQAPKKNR